MTAPGRQVTAGDVLEVIRAAVGRVLDVEPSSVQRGTRWREDLEADSLALVEVVEIVEEELSGRLGRAFGVDDDALDRLATVGDAVDYAVARL